MQDHAKKEIETEDHPDHVPQRQPYEKPVVRAIEIVAYEVLGTAGGLLDVGCC